MTLDILFTYLTMDERGEKESVWGRCGNSDMFKLMEILLGPLKIFFLSKKIFNETL